MGFLKRVVARRHASPETLEADRRIVRFQRVVEQHQELLDLFSDLKDKGTGEYILDRQYIEAQLDRAYEGGRRILYDTNVLAGPDGEEGYEELDRIRSVSEQTFRNRVRNEYVRLGEEGKDDLDWEIQALREIYTQLTRDGEYEGEPSGVDAPGPVSLPSLAERAGWAHVAAARWMAEHLSSRSDVSASVLCGPSSTSLRLDLFPLGGMRWSPELLAGCLEKESSELNLTVEMLPLRYFLEGLARCPRSPEDETAFSVTTGEKATPGPVPGLRLYVGEGFLFLVLPPTLPIRLFWSSLSVNDAENLFYLFGTGSPACSGPGSARKASARETYPSYFTHTTSGSWIHWVSGFSWVQGEERLRELGHLLAGNLDAVPDEGRGSWERMRLGIQSLLNEIVSFDSVCTGTDS